MGGRLVQQRGAVLPGGWRATVAAVLVVGVAAPAAGQWQKNQYQMEKEALRRFEPAPLVVERRSNREAPVILRVRFYADDDFRTGSGAWQEWLRAELREINQILEPAFGARFEAESFRRWNRQGAKGALQPMLVELEHLDAGLDVDWVVGLVSPLPLVSMSFHDLGWAEVPGRHFVLRGMSSIAELDDFNRNFRALGQTDRDALYVRRKRHKELAVFLHEWAHTLGALHLEDPTRIMGPGYSQRTSVLSREEGDLLAAGLEARLASRGKEAIDWTPLRELLMSSPSPGWRPEERQALLARLGSGARAPGHPPTATAPRATATATTTTPPRGTAITTTAPSRAVSAAPASPVPPFVTEAEALLRGHQRAPALAIIRRAAAEAGEARERWLDIAAIYTEAGALTAAQDALGHAGTGDDARAVGRDIEAARRRVGLPASNPRFHVEPAQEPELAELFDDASTLMTASQLTQAHAMVEGGLRRFPHAPGLLTLSCEIALRRSKDQEGSRRCSEALAITPDLPRAHYLLGRLQAQSGRSDAALRSLRRSVELDPSYRPTWDLLGEVYRGLGRQREFMKLLAEHPEASSPAP